jgi:tripartite-type tricarboxylate transporter receptor subunit TctC
LAVDRGEADGLLMGLTATEALRPQWLKAGSGMRVLLQFARTTRHPLFPDVPTADELATSDEARGLLGLAEVSFKLGWPMAGPPAIPRDRAQALQKAFLAVQSDPDYLADAKRQNFYLSPISGDQISALIGQLYSTPPEALNYMRRLRVTKGKG